MNFLELAKFVLFMCFQLLQIVYILIVSDKNERKNGR